MLFTSRVVTMAQLIILAGLLALALSGCGISTTAPPAPAPAELALSAVTFRDGLARVELSGAGFALEAMLAIRLGRPQPVGQAIATVAADAAGRWASEVIIPDTLPSGEPVLPGELALVVMDPNTNAVLASIPFTLPEPPAAPGEPSAFPGPAWVERSRGDLNGDGVEDLLAIIPFAGGVDGELAARFGVAAFPVRELVLAQAGAELLRVAPRAVAAGGVALQSFPGGDPPEGYLVVLDPGSMNLVSLVPLRLDGRQGGDVIALNWYGAERGFQLAPRPPAVEQPAGAPAALPLPADGAAIAAAARAHLVAEGAGLPTLAAAVAIDGDAAYAIGQAFNSGEVRHLFLRRDELGAWSVALGQTNSVDLGALTAAGLPANVGLPTAAADQLALALFLRLHDPRGQGTDGTLIIERVSADGRFARATFAPADPRIQEGFIFFFQQYEGSWTFLTGGSAFMPADLDALGIPADVR